MSANTIKYYLRECAHSIFRNGWLSMASVGTIVISLLILGGSLLLVLNVRYIATTVESSLEITAYLNDQLNAQAVKQLKEEIEFIPGVAQVVFITKEQALEELKDSFGDRAGTLSGLDKNNPLPNLYRIKTAHAQDVPAAAVQLEQLKGVDEVQYGQGMVERLLSLTHWVRIWGLLTMAVLGIAAVFLIATTIRMSVFARKREIGIMKMLGATNFFVRMPFMLEGMVLGLLGGLLATLIIYFAYTSLVVKVAMALPFVQLIQDQTTLYQILGGLLGLGFVIGALGSGISLHRFLRV